MRATAGTSPAHDAVGEYAALRNPAPTVMPVQDACPRVPPLAGCPQFSEVNRLGHGSVPAYHANGTGEGGMRQRVRCTWW